VSRAAAGLAAAGLAALGAAGTAGCGPGQRDAGMLGDSGAFNCAVDPITNPDNAVEATVASLPLTCPPGTSGIGLETTGQVCPSGDSDWYHFSVPAGDDILVVRLRNATPLSPVDLEYTIYNGDGMTVVPGADDYDSNGADGITCVTFNYLVTPGADYYAAVRDNDIGNGESDDNNDYFLALATAADVDPYERNDDAASATPATPGAAMAGATIAYKGDEDWFSFSAGVTDAVRIQLAADAASPVDLHFDIRDTNGQTVASGGDDDGSDAPTAFDEMRGLTGAGTYYVVVTDLGGGESDLAMTYSLTLTLVMNPDMNEPNNSPAAATTLTSGVPNGLGMIFTPGDVDWFVVNVGAIPAVMEILVDAVPGIPLQVSMVSTDPMSPCTPGATDCQNLVEVCPPPSTDPMNPTFPFLECPSSACDLSTDPDTCVGAGECLGGSCAYLQITRAGSDVRTAGPVRVTGPTWVRIAAMAPGDSDLTNTYTVTVTVAPEPDAGEPDNWYFPNLVQTQFVDPMTHDELYEELLSRDFGMGRPIALDTTYTGYISYEGDIDVFTLPHPCPGADCGLNITFSSPAGAVEYKYFLHDDPATIWCSVGNENEPTTPGAYSTQVAEGYTFGTMPGECCFADNMGPASYRMVVRDHNFNDWNWSAPYSFSITRLGTGAACAPPPEPTFLCDPADIAACMTSTCCPIACCGVSQCGCD
jgi:hypothetical protein